MLAVACVGCAKPQGTMFPPVEPPIVWPPAPEKPRIKWVGTFSGSHDLKAAQPAKEVFLAAMRGPRPPIRLSGPHSVAPAPQDLLAVADTTGACVHLIDFQNRTHARITGWNSQRFQSPVGVAWVGERLFVTDAARHEIIELDKQGACRNLFGRDELQRPVGIVYVAARNQLYVVDGGAHCIVVFEPTGEVVTRIGERGSAPGQLNYPTHLSWDGGGRLLVADSGNFRVQLLDLNGACLTSLGKKGDGAGDFALPKGVAFDSENHIYVVDGHFENVQIFNDQGQLLLAFGEEGNGPGEFSLPAGLAIDDRDRIWVADSGNRRVQVFDYLRDSR